MKIGIFQGTNHGKEKWQVSYAQPGHKRKRLFFDTKKDAEAEKARLIDQQDATGKIWLHLTILRNTNTVREYVANWQIHNGHSNTLPKRTPHTEQPTADTNAPATPTP